MAINFGNGGRFSFGPTSPVEQNLFETNHDLAYQKFLDWAGNGNLNFGNTNAGRYLQQQQGAWDNRFVNAQAQQTDRLAQAKTAWDAQEAQRKAAWDAQQQQAKDAWQNEYNHWVQEYVRGKSGINGQEDKATMALAQYNMSRLKSNPFTPGTYTPGTYTPPEEMLTYEKWLEQNQGAMTNGFNELTAAMRGANPGNFQIRRNLW